MPVPTPFPDPAAAPALSFGTAPNVSVEVLPQPALLTAPASPEPPLGPPPSVDPPPSPDPPLLDPEPPLLDPEPPLDPELVDMPLLDVEPPLELPELAAPPLLELPEPASGPELLDLSPHATAVKATHIANRTGAGKRFAVGLLGPLRPPPTRRSRGLRGRYFSSVVTIRYRQCPSSPKSVTVVHCFDDIAFFYSRRTRVAAHERRHRERVAVSSPFAFTACIPLR
jgi:hypothetical protein